MASGNWYVKSDTLLLVKGLKDEAGVVVNNAVLTGVLQDKKGAAVDGVGNVIFNYVAASSGDYKATVPAAAAMKEGTDYDLIVTCGINGKVLTLRIRRTAKMLSV